MELVRFGKEPLNYYYLFFKYICKHVVNNILHMVWLSYLKDTEMNNFYNKLYNIKHLWFFELKQ